MLIDVLVVPVVLALVLFPTRTCDFGASHIRRKHHSTSTTSYYQTVLRLACGGFLYHTALNVFRAYICEVGKTKSSARLCKI